jgi:solute carrier family 25 protein 34/35
MSIQTFSIGALAACGAVTFTNPFEVVKTRMQLQGELQAKGKVLYSNAPRAFMTILKNEGLSGIQKGLGVACKLSAVKTTDLYQIVLNGTRLGFYEPMKEAIQSVLSNLNSGRLYHVLPMITSGALTGVMGAFFASPLFLIKTRVQSLTNIQALQGIGHQHTYLSKGVIPALIMIYKTEGIRGLWRGADASMIRTGIGSSVQLSSYDISKEFVIASQVYDQSSTSGQLKTHVTASLITSFLVCFAMNPFDVASTRMYNQKTDNNKNVGALYRNGFDCIRKIIRIEGLSALYKGFQAHYLRIGKYCL